MECPDCGTPNADDARRCVHCRVLLDDLEYEDATIGYSGMIPSRNGPALAAYYLGIFAFIPFLGILLGIPAFFLGLKGLKNVARFPEVKGKVHAWIGVLVGGFFSVVWLIAILVLLPRAG